MVGTTKGTGISLFLEKIRNPGTVPGTQVPSSPNVVPWDANPWDSWDWDKNPWDSPVILSFGTQVRGTKNLGTGSPVPCPPLIFDEILFILYQEYSFFS